MKRSRCPRADAVRCEIVARRQACGVTCHLPGLSPTFWAVVSIPEPPNRQGSGYCSQQADHGMGNGRVSGRKALIQRVARCSTSCTSAVSNVDSQTPVEFPETPKGEEGNKMTHFGLWFDFLRIQHHGWGCGRERT